MKNPFDNTRLHQIPIDKIEEDRLTDFSAGADVSRLETSIKEIGITQPVILAPAKNGYRIVCGHRRLAAARRFNFETLPAFLTDPSMKPADQLKLNLVNNLGQRHYSDIEKGLAVIKLTEAGVLEDELIDDFLPLLGLERGKKLLEDFLKIKKFSEALSRLLHEGNIPLRVFSALFSWDEKSLAQIDKTLAVLKPGVNKLRELLELTDELAGRENLSPHKILTRPEIQSAMENPETPAPEKYDSICRLLRQWRYPNLTKLQNEVLLLLDQIKLDPRSKLRIAESFEHEEIRIELKFTDRQQLLSQIEKLSHAADSEAMKELIHLLKNPGR